MNLYGLNCGFSNFGDPRFRDKARFIVTCVTTEPMLTLVPEPTPALYPTRLDLTTALAAYEAAANAAKDSLIAKKDRNNKRAVLERLLKDFAPVVVAAAKTANDITILSKSGYTVRHGNGKVVANNAPPSVHPRQARHTQRLGDRCEVGRACTGSIRLKRVPRSGIRRRMRTSKAASRARLVRGLCLPGWNWEAVPVPRPRRQ